MANGLWRLLLKQSTDLSNLIGHKCQNVVDAEETNCAPIAIDNGQPSIGAAAHEFQGLIDGSLFSDALRERLHDLPHFHSRRIARLRTSEREVTVGQHAQRPLVIVDDDQATDTAFLHPLFRDGNGIVRVHRNQVSRANVSDGHFCSSCQ
ncbi:MAG TPA: hypothetical protein VEI07_08710 [Planctomycetaceae bacterium]|nr:hypothetical protein [Planctomycetaceae bacterium]